MARRRSDDDTPADEIRWRDADGGLVRCCPPASRPGVALGLAEVLAWAGRWSIPREAAVSWFGRADRGPGKLTVRADRDVTVIPPMMKGMM
jgi:hypothetical protein